MNPIFSYLEYRDYLKDHFEFEKSRKSFYSYRYISSKTGIDASYYVKVLNKQRHIGKTKLSPLTNFLQLQGRELKYFNTLVEFNRTRNSKTTKELFGKLTNIKNSIGERIDDYSYFSEWYIIPTRELLGIFNFKDNYKELANQFHPPIKESEAKTAIKVLKELEMLECDSDGFLRPIDAILTAGSQWRSIAVKKFQKKMITNAEKAIDIFPKDERDISSVTISTSKKSMKLISERISQMRQEILEMITSEDEVDGVYQINLQVFPLTKKVTNDQ